MKEFGNEQKYSEVQKRTLNHTDAATIKKRSLHISLGSMFQLAMVIHTQIDVRCTLPINPRHFQWHPNSATS